MIQLTRAVHLPEISHCVIPAAVMWRLFHTGNQQFIHWALVTHPCKVVRLGILIGSLSNDNGDA